MSDDKRAAFQLSFAGTLTIRTADTAYSSLCAALAEHQHIAIDCAEAVDIDLSFLQLLIAAHLSACRADKTLAFAGPPEGVLLERLFRSGFDIAVTDAGDIWFTGAAA